MSSANARRENAEFERRVKRRPQLPQQNRWPPSDVVPSFVTSSELQRTHDINASSWHSDYPPHAVAREPSRSIRPTRGCAGAFTVPLRTAPFGVRSPAGNVGSAKEMLSMRNWRLVLTILAALVVTLSAAFTTFSGSSLLNSDPNEPGRGGDNTTRLINQRAITPAGKQTMLGDLPLNSILSPDGKHLVVANGGAGIQSLQVIDTATSRVVQSLTYTVPDGVFVGLAYSSDGTTVFASSGGNNTIHMYSVGANGMLTATGDFSAGPRMSTPLGNGPWPIGLGLSHDNSTLYVANNLGSSVGIFDTASKTLKATVPVGSFPYTTQLSRDGKQVFVSNWGDATISVIDTAAQRVTATIPVGNHPTAMTLGAGDLLFVSDSNSDAISVIHVSQLKETRRISLGPYDHAQLSTTPEGLALSPDNKTLYVADAGADEIAVVGLDDSGEPTGVRGRIPTAWYPTSVVVSSDGKTLFVTNGKGEGAGPNSANLYPNPTRMNPPIVDGVTGYNDGYCNCTFDNYTGTMMTGTLSTIEVPREGLLRVYTNQVARDNRYPNASGSQAADRDPRSPIPLPGGSSPIKHVIYVIKENRTFDQVLGDLSIGDTDPALVLFGQTNTPNLHALAERFGVLDSFYADAEVSADGHNWSTSAYASDYNEKMWPQDYSPGVGRNRGYDFEGGTTINLSPGGYLWDAARDAGISLRNYGEFANNGPLAQATQISESQADSCSGPIAHSYTGVTIAPGNVLCFPATTVNATTTPGLVGTVDPKFRSYDLRYREGDRLAEWQREFDHYVATDSLPQLEIMRLPNDHTSGTQPGRLTPQAYVAENDYAVGKLVDIVSHSKYWSSTAIFIVEDDAQNGPDHVDAHRTEALVISPFTSRRQPRVEHTLYDTAAMLRTMELILGLRPLRQYDANSVPLWRLFKPGAVDPEDLATYDALPESVPPTQLNGASAFGAAESLAMDFEQEDRAPMDELNHIIWGAVKGADTPYPDRQTTHNNSTDDD
jgi:YVTN family beta-propeller protein